MRERLEQALKKSRAEYTEIRIEETVVSGLNFRGEELDSIGSSATTGGIVRALVKGGWGVATFNDLSDLDLLCSSAAVLCSLRSLRLCGEFGLLPLQVNFAGARKLWSAKSPDFAAMTGVIALQNLFGGARLSKSIPKGEAF